jgi:hypothetical protein
VHLGFDLRSAWLYREVLALWLFPTLIVLRFAVLRCSLGFGGWKLIAGVISTAGVSGMLISVLPVAVFLCVLIDYYLIGWFFGHRNPATVTILVTILVSSGLATLIDCVILRWVFRGRIHSRGLAMLAVTNAVAFVVAGYAMVDFIMKHPPEA